MKNIIIISVLILFNILVAEESAMPNIYDFTMENIRENRLN